MILHYGINIYEIQLANLLSPDSEPYTAMALADTEALHLCIPQHIAAQLKLKQLEEREVTIADGSRRLVRYVREVLLGAILMEDIDLVIQPALLQVTALPPKPNTYERG